MKKERSRKRDIERLQGGEFKREFKRVRERERVQDIESYENGVFKNVQSVDCVFLSRVGRSEVQSS